MKINHLLSFAIIMPLLWSCGAPKTIAYFQDIEPGDNVLLAKDPLEIKIQPKDKLSIIVYCQDPLLTNMFNLPVMTSQIGMESSSASSRGLSGYTVTNEGTIDFPVLGELNVEGMTRENLAAHIKNELVAQDLVKDPVVTVEFANLAISVLGEVNHPGRYDIDRDRLTVIDALSMAGDLTIYGKRDKIMVMRQENGSHRAFAINLNSAEQLYNSPGYYLHQGDIVYVEPNDTRKRQSTVNGNTVRSASFWISLTSLATSIALLIVNAIGNSNGGK